MLFLSNEIKEDLIKHAREEYPNEACGILAGKFGRESDQAERRTLKSYRMTNTNKSRESFLMDPKEQFNVIKDMRGKGLEMIGIYHSHPETREYPSAHDVRQAYYQEVSYIIVSLEDKGKPGLKSYRIIEGEIKEEEIKSEYA